MRLTVTASVVLLTLFIAATAEAFCGFYVARADTGLFNRASQVVIVRDQDRTVMTMANDFRGDVEDFAIVIPVPTFIEREQINVADRTLIEHLDAYTAPRLVEYHDPDPCMRQQWRKHGALTDMAMPSAQFELAASGRSQGVTIEASYTIGEYDILILSAAQSSGLTRWLNDNGYHIPDGAQRVVESYLKQDMRFFVARVNLSEQAKLGYSYLRPLQVAYESNKFMLPIRLGTLNAQNEQELYVYALTRTGRVETTNYRTVRVPSNTELPEFVEDEFAGFYRAMFARQVARENQRAVFLEYAWDMAWCDPCAANPLSQDELRRLGVFWVGGKDTGRIAPSQAQDVFVTRLHLRYDRVTFPEDLVFQETGDRQNFQGRYVIRHPFKSEIRCDASQYTAAVRDRQEREAQALANLTGWNIEDVRARIPYYRGVSPEPAVPWWRRVWE
jgi:hypothetical protein